MKTDSEELMNIGLSWILIKLPVDSVISVASVAKLIHVSYRINAWTS